MYAAGWEALHALMENGGYDLLGSDLDCAVTVGEIMQSILHGPLALAAGPAVHEMLARVVAQLSQASPIDFR